jgi:hypothetical protein
MSDMTPAEAWDMQGFFILRGLIPRDLTEMIERETVAAIRHDPPAAHPGEVAYRTTGDLLIYPEKMPSPAARQPEEFIAKVFNCHAGDGAAGALGGDRRLTDPLRFVLGEAIDCFQSQFIFKNPGVLGQPWHQDAFYFRYDRQPQITVWVALSRATLENGCLWVVPGSHRATTVFAHVPDQRPGSLQGYLEIVSEDTTEQCPVTMEPGDVLFFHSYLMHRSTDNIADERRSAMVYHYAEAGTQAIDAATAAALAPVNRWVAARR